MSATINDWQTHWLSLFILMDSDFMGSSFIYWHLLIKKLVCNAQFNTPAAVWPPLSVRPAICQPLSACLSSGSAVKRQTYKQIQDGRNQGHKDETPKADAHEARGPVTRENEKIHP